MTDRWTGERGTRQSETERGLQKARTTKTWMVFAVPTERPVILKERAAGAYRLSAFYFAKMSSELPLTLLMPSLFCTLTYWMAGMRGLPQFFATWAILLLNILNCQVDSPVLVRQVDGPFSCLNYQVGSPVLACQVDGRSL